MTQHPAQTFTSSRAIGVWLALTSLMVIAMIMVGGLTRLTDSGLSITEWKPVTGALPPLSAEAWEVELEKYRQIPEYQIQNRGMSMDEFKLIYWWEWGHRQLGRAIGLVYGAPLLVFWLSGRIPGALKPRLLVLLGLGGLQGAVGWWMVASGLSERVDVSPYRLATHLGLAFIILAGLWWTMLDAFAGRLSRWSWRSVSGLAGVFTAAVFMQILLGAFVAGMDAGRIYNTFPLMEGRFVPNDYGALSPFWRDAFENHASVQFHHRIGAYVVALLAAILVWRSWAEARLRIAAVALGAITLSQIALGVWTLLAVAPLSLSAKHQAMAVVLWLAALTLWRSASALSCPSAAPRLQDPAQSPEPAG